MPESESPRPEPSIEPSGRKSDPNPDAISPETDCAYGAMERIESSSGLPKEPENENSRLDRFSYLSSEMISLISELYQDIKTAVNEHRAVEEELNQKRNELHTLYNIEGSAAELEQIVERHNKQISDLERVIESRRNAIETEKSRWKKEEAEYLENRNIRRQREEEEYRQQWAVEQEKAKRALENERLLIQQKSHEALEALKHNLSEREEQIQRKESEMNLLIQELDQLMSNLARRTRSQESRPSFLSNPRLAMRTKPPEGTPVLEEAEAPDSDLGW